MIGAEAETQNIVEIRMPEEVVSARKAVQNRISPAEPPFLYYRSDPISANVVPSTAGNCIYIFTVSSYCTGQSTEYLLEIMYH
jgi:hypothetical protein